MRSALVIVCILLVCACHKPQAIPGQLAIEWKKDLKGDFTFANQWDYPAGVYKNEYGQLSCDGFCPPETDAMKDLQGRIFDDSLSAFYQWVDTTHQVHSLQSEAQCPEWAGTDYMFATRVQDTIVCYSLCNAATHCSLRLRLIHNTCMASVLLQSITGRTTTYLLERGYIKIDPEQLQKGILKAAFQLDFGKDRLSGKPVLWKGLIYTKVQS